MMLTKPVETLPDHGTRARYDAPHSCRCGTCRRGNRERAAEARRKRLESRVWACDGSVDGGYWFARDASEHNASTYSNWGCRCQDCKDDHSIRLKA
jgi:hypothetical protein